MHKGHLAADANIHWITVNSRVAPSRERPVMDRRGSALIAETSRNPMAAATARRLMQSIRAAILMFRMVKECLG